MVHKLKYIIIDLLRWEIQMKDKKSVLLIVIALLILALVACTNGSQESQGSAGNTKQNQQFKNNQDTVDSTDRNEDQATFTGTIEEINGNMALLSIDKGEILKSGSIVDVNLSVESVTTFQIVDRVIVGHDRDIRETFPLGINTTFVELVK